MNASTPRKIVLDTETTGKQKDDRIIELGMVEIDHQGRQLKELHYYFNPQQKIHAGAMRVHGLNMQFLRDKPLFTDKAAEIHDFLQGSTVIIHNAPFDIYYLDYEFALTAQRSGASFIPMKKRCAKVQDTLELARQKFPEQSNSLDALIDRFGISAKEREARHGALIDARLLAEVYIRLITHQGVLIGNDDNAELSPDSPEATSLPDIASLRPFKTVPPSPEEEKAHKDFMRDL